VVVERFPDYWEPGEDGDPLPYLDEVVSRIIPDLTVATAELAARTVDVVQELPPSQYNAVTALETLAADVWHWAGLSVITGHINTLRPPFDDIRVRQALNYGINREALAQAAGFGLGVPASLNNAAGEASEGWTEEAEHMYDFDPERAKALLADAGYPDGIQTTMKSIFREPDNTAAQFVVQTWKESNINVESLLQERTTWIEDVVTNRDFDLAFSRYPLAGISPFFFRPNWSCEGSNNYESVCDPVVDDLITQGEAEVDPARRNALAQELYMHVQEQAYHFNGFRMPQVLARQANIQGIVPDWATPNLKGAWRSEV
jgi:peptide/nickel transport system substrate-binding protein